MGCVTSNPRTAGSVNPNDVKKEEPAMGTVKSKKSGKKESNAPAITVTDAGENGPKMPEPTNAGPHSETLDKMAEGDAKKRIREYFSNPKNLKKITTQFQREMKELGVNRKVLNQIQEELQGDDEDDTDDSFALGEEEEVEAKVEMTEEE